MLSLQFTDCPIEKLIFFFVLPFNAVILKLFSRISYNFEIILNLNLQPFNWFIKKPPNHQSFWGSSML